MRALQAVTSGLPIFHDYERAGKRVFVEYGEYGECHGYAIWETATRHFTLITGSSHTDSNGWVTPTLCAPCRESSHSGPVAVAVHRERQWLPVRPPVVTVGVLEDSDGLPRSLGTCWDLV